MFFLTHENIFEIHEKHLDIHENVTECIKHNENCILVEPQNTKELSTAILDLLENEEKREKLGKSGYDLVHRECNSEQMTKETMRIYEQLIKDN